VPDHAETYARCVPAWTGADAFVNENQVQYPGLEMHAKVFPYSGYRSGVLEFAALVNADLVAVGTRGRAICATSCYARGKILRDAFAVLAVSALIRSGLREVERVMGINPRELPTRSPINHLPSAIISRVIDVDRAPPSLPREWPQ